MAGIAAGLVVLLIFGKKIFKAAPRRRRRHYTSAPVRHRRQTSIRSRTRRTKGAKKPWQVKGSEAARRHMARLRRMR
jgi:hypothetical protein